MRSNAPPFGVAAACRAKTAAGGETCQHETRVRKTLAHQRDEIGEIVVELV
jgi:hypothetical protein